METEVLPSDNFMSGYETPQVQIISRVGHLLKFGGRYSSYSES